MHLQKICVNCNTPFIVLEREQGFLKNLYGDKYREPGNCIKCRRRRRGESVEPVRNIPAVQEAPEELWHRVWSD